MKVGLLECDHVVDEFRTIAGDYRDMFPALLPDLEFENYDVCNGHFPKSADACSAYLCTGSRFSVYEQKAWISDLKSFVQEVHNKQIKFVGVCFGHQILAEALGGNVEKTDRGWSVGIHSFDLLQPKPWMQPSHSSFNLLMMCQDQVLRLPENAKVLATAKNCPVGMFQVGENMLGIQAHPEFPKAYDKALMEDRIKRIGAETVLAGIKSLDLPLHEHAVAGWIKQFLHS